MLNFKEWLLISETKEEKILAVELAGDALTDLSTVIPQKDKNADKLLLLAAYYYSQTKDLEQVKTDMKDYIVYLNRDKMKLITVDLVSKKPPSPWDDHLYWTQMIHMYQGEDAFKERSKFKPSQDDFQGEIPFMISQDGQIKVYEANSPQQCIILGRGQSFCISQPGNRNWQGYRDKENSTFYFVYDDTRDDRLSIVVVDVRENGIVLTDRPNNTGTTLDPYTGQLTYDSKPYMRYLKEKGIDVSKFVNIPKSEEESYENRELGRFNKDFNWFVYLSSDYKSKYIGRGNQLTDEQFDYLWNNKFDSLLIQYAQTGLLLPDYQLDKVVSNRDLRDKYLHNRGIADQNSNDLTMKEYSLFSVKQKESYYDNLNDYNKLQKAIKFKDLDFYKYLLNEKGLKLPNYAVESATRTGNLDLVKFFIEKGAKIDEFSDKEDAILVTIATNRGNLDLVKYLVDEKKQPIANNIVREAILSGNLDIVRYFVDEKKKPILGNYAVENAIRSGNVDVVKYLVDEKGKEVHNHYIKYAIASGDLPIVKYLVDEKNLKVSGLDIDYAEKEGLYNIGIYFYLKSVKERQ